MALPLKVSRKSLLRLSFTLFDWNSYWNWRLYRSLYWNDFKHIYLPMLGLCRRNHAVYNIHEIIPNAKPPQGRASSIGLIIGFVVGIILYF